MKQLEIEYPTTVEAVHTPSICLINGDCYEKLKEIPDGSVDLVIIDPPYLIENTKAGGKSNLAKSIQLMNNELEQNKLTKGIDYNLLEQFVRLLKKINIYIWCNSKQIPEYFKFFIDKYKCSFDILIWNKTNATPLFHNKYLTDKEYCLYFRKGGICQPKNYESAKTVYYLPINVKDKRKYNHPTIKPLEIIKNLVINSSLEGDTVLDCFMGSGTTGVACKELNRNFIGIEIDKTYFDIAQERINNA